MLYLLLTCFFWSKGLVRIPRVRSAGTVAEFVHVLLPLVFTPDGAWRGIPTWNTCNTCNEVSRTPLILRHGWRCQGRTLRCEMGGKNEKHEKRGKRAHSPLHSSRYSQTCRILSISFSLGTPFPSSTSVCEAFTFYSFSF